MKRSITTAAIVTMTGLGLLTACGTETGATSNAQPVASPAFFFDQVQKIRSRELDVLEPANLTQALPNATPTIPGLKGGAKPFTDAVISGSVDSVVPGVGYDYSPSGAMTKEVSFNDSAADARDVVVTLAVDNVVGKTTGKTAAFRMGILGNADAESFMASLRGLGNTVVLLKQIPDGSHAGEMYPILNGAGVATVDDSARLDFPGLGAEARSFRNGIATPTQLMNAASGS